MTTMELPEFITSPFFVPEFDNWYLKPGAPPEVVKEFEEWMNSYDESMTMEPDASNISNSRA